MQAHDQPLDVMPPLQPDYTLALQHSSEPRYGAALTTDQAVAASVVPATLPDDQALDRAPEPAVDDRFTSAELSLAARFQDVQDETQVEDVSVDERTAGTSQLNNDVLDLIFKEVVACRMLEQYDQEFAAAPFVLAAVCRQWRTVVLGSPLLWTHLTMPCGESGSTYQLYAQLVIERSEEQLLHVQIYDCDELSLVRHRGALQTVMAAANRWRALNIFGQPFAWARWRRIMYVPTPELDFVTIQGDVVGRDDDDERWRPDTETFDFLPNAPKLRTLEISAIPFLSSPISTFSPSPLRTWEGPRPTPNGLTQLRLFLLHVQAERIHDVLRNAPQLVELQLTVIKLGVNLLHLALGGAATNYDLPALKFLDVRGIAAVLFTRADAALRLDALQEVSVQPECIRLMAECFKKRDMPALTCVTVGYGNGPLHASQIDDLSCLRHVDTLSLECDVEETFFVGLGERAELLWPQLHTIHFDYEMESNTMPEMRNKVLGYIQAKRARHRENERVSEIKHACLNHKGLANTDIRDLIHEDPAPSPELVEGLFDYVVHES